MASKTTALERLERLLKQGSSISEVKSFREQVRDVYGLGNIDGLDTWIDARRELGLLKDPAVASAACGLQNAISSVIKEACRALPKPKPRRSWEEQYRLINERETERRQNLPPIGYRPPVDRASMSKRSRQRPLISSTNQATEIKRPSIVERMSAMWKKLTYSRIDGAAEAPPTTATEIGGDLGGGLDSVVATTAGNGGIASFTYVQWEELVGSK